MAKCEVLKCSFNPGDRDEFFCNCLEAYYNPRNQIITKTDGSSHEWVRFTGDEWDEIIKHLTRKLESDKEEHFINRNRSYRKRQYQRQKQQKEFMEKLNNAE